MTDVRLTATNPEDSSVVPVACNDKGELKLEEPIKFDGNLNGDLSVTGDADLGGILTSKSIDVTQTTSGYTFIGRNPDGDATFYIEDDGAVVFAKGKAGFTKDGYLWCTTERGDTVYLQATSNGLGSWAAFTPFAGLEQLKEKVDEVKGQLDEWSEKDKPAESQ